MDSEKTHSSNQILNILIDTFMTEKQQLMEVDFDKKEFEKVTPTNLTYSIQQQMINE